MDLIEELRAFVATAQTGSFTAAADQLRVSNRLTSKYVAELEARLGVRLLQRTTRRVGLTPAGAELMARVPALIEDLDAALAEVSEGSKGFSGVIRVSAPVTFGESHVAGMLERFGRWNPNLGFDLRLDDRFVDLAAEGIDVAFRIGRSEMLSLKTRKLGVSKSVLVAAPGYLAAQGRPERPEDLAAHSCIVDTNRRAPKRWGLTAPGKQGGTEGGGEEVTVTVAGRYHVNSARAAVAVAIEGLGIANVPRFALGDALASGRLVPVLPGFESDAGPISAVWLEGRVLPRKLRALIDFAATDIRSAGPL